DNSVWALTSIAVNPEYPRSTYPPITSNALQSIYNGGESDILLVHINADLSNLMFCSFFGGTRADLGTSIQSNDSGDVVISGITNSMDLPTTRNVIHPNYLGGISDGFVAIINAQTYELKHATY